MIKLGDSVWASLFHWKCLIFGYDIIAINLNEELKRAAVRRDVQFYKRLRFDELYHIVWLILHADYYHVCTLFTMIIIQYQIGII